MAKGKSGSGNNSGKKRPSFVVDASVIKALVGNNDTGEPEDDGNEGGDEGRNVVLSLSNNSSEGDIAGFRGKRKNELKGYDEDAKVDRIVELEVSLHRIRHKLRAFRENVPEGSLVVQGDFAEIMGDLLERFTDPKALKDWLDNYTKLESAHRESEREKEINRIAEKADVNPVALKALSRDEVYDTITMPDPQDATKQIEQVVVVKSDGTKVPFSQYAQQTWAPFMESLKVKAAENNASSAGTDVNNQNQGNAGSPAFNGFSGGFGNNGSNNNSNYDPSSALRSMLPGGQNNAQQQNNQQQNNQQQQQQQPGGFVDTFSLYGGK